MLVVLEPDGKRVSLTENWPYALNLWKLETEKPDVEEAARLDLIVRGENKKPLRRIREKIARRAKLRRERAIVDFFGLRQSTASALCVLKTFCVQDQRNMNWLCS